MADFCAFCGKELPAHIRQLRHRSSADIRPLYCDRAHQAADLVRKNHFKAMSVQGRPQRSEAVKQSNHLKPRRKRKS